MNALGLVVSVKIFKNCILRFFFGSVITYITNWNYSNNFGRYYPKIISKKFGQHSESDIKG